MFMRLLVIMFMKLPGVKSVKLSVVMFMKLSVAMFMKLSMLQPLSMIQSGLATRLTRKRCASIIGSSSWVSSTKRRATRCLVTAMSW